MDGFSTKKNKQAILPDRLFFGEYKNVDLSKDYDDKKKNNLTVFGLIDILNHYKFTIEENTPVEVEVALDPELLGKVFENLLASYNPETQTTARKQTGSFYTPREIVSYMVDESIIAYLKNYIDDENRLRKLFSYEGNNNENPFNKSETFTLLKAIDKCRVLDPACGSGAFPMGVLQKLIYVLHKLDPLNNLWFDLVIENIPAYMREEFRKRLKKESWNYVRKIGIIQQCIYGVDIQPIATQIAKLRFFISLLVDQADKPFEPNRGFEPLPNLDFKIVTANTLVPAPASDVKSEGLFENQTDTYFLNFDKLTEQYFTTSNEKEKNGLKKKITDLIDAKCNEKVAEIENKYSSDDERVRKALKEKYTKFITAKQNEVDLWKSYKNIFKHEPVGFFEPKYFFPKVKDGFDVVIGNPPWVSLIGKHGIKDNEKNITLYQRLYNGNTYMPNLYEYFILKSLNLLKANGELAFIVPDRLGNNSSLAYLRRKLLTESVVNEIVYRWKFESIIADTMTILVSNAKNTKYNIKVKYKPFMDSLSVSSSIYLGDSECIFKSYINQKIMDIVSKIKSSSVPLVKYCKTTSGFGGKSELLTEERMTKKQIEVIKGNCISKYAIIKKLYFDFKEENISGRTRDKLKLGKREKILIRKTGDTIIATYDNSGIYPEQSLYFLYDFINDSCPNIILVILNSSLLTWYYLNELVTNIDSTPQLKNYDLDSIPIRESLDFSKYFINLAKYLIYLAKSKHQIFDFFYQLSDAMVYELYFPQEIKTAGCEVLKHLTDLAELKDEWSDEKKLKTIEKVHKELSSANHPVSIAMFKMDTVEEVRIIEGKQ